MTVTRQWVYTTGSTVATSYNLTIPDALVTGDVYVAVDVGNYSATSQHATALSGLGATWTRFASAQNMVSDVWVGLGGSDLSGGQNLSVTAPTMDPIVSKRGMILYCFRGISTTVAVRLATATSATATTASTTVGSGQAAIAFGYSDTSADALKSLVPASGWSSTSTLDLIAGSRWAAFASRIPSASDAHTASASRSSGSTFVTLLTVGDTDTPLTGVWGSVPIK